MKLIKNNKKEKGFTLIELVVVIAILAILALILIPSLSGYKTKADKSKNEANARNIYTAATLVLEDKPNADEDAIKTAIESENLIDSKNLDGAKITVSDDKKITVTVGEGNSAATYPSDNTPTP